MSASPHEVMLHQQLLLQHLAEQEAAAHGMDLQTYAAALAEQQHIEHAQLEQAYFAQAQLEQAHLEQAQLAEAHACEAAMMQALAEQEAAAAGMDLPTYAAALQQQVATTHPDELALHVEAAYRQGVAQFHAELAAHEAALAGLTPDELQHLRHLELLQLQEAQALGLI